MKSEVATFTIKLKFGKGMLEYQASDMKSIHKFSSIWGRLPQKCTNCESDDIILSFKNPGGNDYYGIMCLSCGAEQNLHQKKEGGFYIKPDDKMLVWQGGNSESVEADGPVDEVPF